MEWSEQLQRQRVKYIVSSYHLAEVEADDRAFYDYLESLMRQFPLPLVELALVEILVKLWVQVPLVRGVDFLDQAHELLQRWHHHPIVSTITPDQFYQITGLDPFPIFGVPAVAMAPR